MASVNAPIINFSGGILGDHLFARVDVPAYARSAEIMDNWRALAQGPMTRRPPTEYLDTLAAPDEVGDLFPFVFNTAQSYMILANNQTFRFYLDGGPLDIKSVTTTIADGDFQNINPDKADDATITGSSTAAGAVANLVDEDATTHWQADGTATGYLDFDHGSALTIYDLWLTADDTDANRAPLSFVLYGSSTGSFAGEEDTLLTVTGADNWSASERRKYRVTTPGAYRYYRLSMTAREGGSGNYKLSEVSMYDSPWLDNSAGNGVVSITGGLLYLDSDGGSNVIAEQAVTIAETTTLHTLQVIVEHGPVNMRIGSASGLLDLADWKNLDVGDHRLTFDPEGNSVVYIQFYHSGNAGRIVSRCDIMAGGVDLTIGYPYEANELAEIQTHQIGDILYMAHENYETRRLERRGHRSWSLVYNRTRNGPYGETNITGTTLSASATSGEVVLTASEALFTDNDPGQLFSMTDSGQTQTASGSAINDATQGINVTGGNATARRFNIQITGTATATVRLQESSGNENNYVDTDTSWSSTGTFNVNSNYYDAKDNQDFFYRLIVEAYTSGTVTMTLTYGGGTSEGSVRVISVNSETEAVVEVLSTLASTSPVTTWKRSIWSEEQGWPSAVGPSYGRLWFGRGTTLWASQSDDFTNFEAGEQSADSFSWTLAQESSEGIIWIHDVGRLAVGTRTREWIGLGNTTSEPVGPTNFQTIPASEEGSAKVRPVRAEGSILYAHRSRRKLMQFTQNPEALNQDTYTSIDLTELAPEILDHEIQSLSIQREPQRRVFAALGNGRLGELLFRREIDVAAWNTAKTQGRIERTAVIQQDDRDKVYMIVKRKINGTWTRMLECYGPEFPDSDADAYHLDCSLSLTPTQPASTIEISYDVAGSEDVDDFVTVTADEAIFVVGDVGKRIWLPRGILTVTAYIDANSVTARITSKLDPFYGTDPIPQGRWRMMAPISSVSGLDHLEGHSVRVFADGIDQGFKTVSSGTVAIDPEAFVVHVGLSFTSYFKSLKLAYGAQKGTALLMKKGLQQLGVLLHRSGPSVGYGRDLDNTYKIPTREQYGNEAAWGDPVPLFTGEINGLDHDTEVQTDPRLTLIVDDPTPATVVGVVAAIQTVDL